MATLRTTILKHALPLIPSQSFTRQTLLSSLGSLPAGHPDKRDLDEGIIDTLFGSGAAGPSALVGEWEAQGLEQMTGKKDVLDRLTCRLEYSASVGEHLVEAYALMASPGSSHSLPIPKLPMSILRNLKLPPLYSPTSPSIGSPSSPSQSPEHVSNTIDQTIEKMSNRLPLVSINPLGPITYAWRIAHAALTPTDRSTGVSKGLMNEPTGSGPEWYSSRLSLLLAYLQAESHLLQPPSSAPHANLSAAVESLKGHLRRYDFAAETFNGAVKTSEGAMTYLEHLGRSLVGIVRSRGL